MLSYQHSYHAGNAADLHKHALVAWVLDYLIRKPKPITYIETHAGRGLYDLSSPEARKTAEADAGITRAETEHALDPDHPLMCALRDVLRQYGRDAYPGSPLIAKHFLRHGDRAHLAELHPAEHLALTEAVGTATCYLDDGFAVARRLIPPTPRRGVMLVDPSYEIKSDYSQIPEFLAAIRRKWNVGVLMLWYPILRDDRHAAMAARLADDHPDALLSQVRFAPARQGHGMVGSAMFVISPPWGMADEARRIEAIFPA